MGRSGDRSIMILDFITPLLTQVLLGVTESSRSISAVTTRLYRKIEIANYTTHEGGGDASDSWERSERRRSDGDKGWGYLC